MKNLISNPTFTSFKDFEELKKDFGSQAVKEMSSDIELFDEQSTATLTYHYSISDAIEAAKDKFIEEFGKEEPQQVNVDLVFLSKDDDKEPYYFVEFMQESGEWKHGSTYASDEKAVKIFKNEELIDSTFLHDNENQIINLD